MSTQSIASKIKVPDYLALLVKNKSSNEVKKVTLFDSKYFDKDVEILSLFDGISYSEYWSEIAKQDIEFNIMKVSMLAGNSNVINPFRYTLIRGDQSFMDAVFLNPFQLQNCLVEGCTKFKLIDHVKFEFLLPALTDICIVLSQKNEAGSDIIASKTISVEDNKNPGFFLEGRLLLQKTDKYLFESAQVDNREVKKPNHLYIIKIEFRGKVLNECGPFALNDLRLKSDESEKVLKQILSFYSLCDDQQNQRIAEAGIKDCGYELKQG